MSAVCSSSARTYWARASCWAAACFWSVDCRSRVTRVPHTPWVRAPPRQPTPAGGPPAGRPTATMKRAVRARSHRSASARRTRHSGSPWRSASPLSSSSHPTCGARLQSRLATARSAASCASTCARRRCGQGRRGRWQPRRPRRRRRGLWRGCRGSTPPQRSCSRSLSRPRRSQPSRPACRCRARAPRQMRRW